VGSMPDMPRDLSVPAMVQRVSMKKTPPIRPAECASNATARIELLRLAA
jgi:hypothetical protein